MLTVPFQRTVSPTRLLGREDVVVEAPTDDGTEDDDDDPAVVLVVTDVAVEPHPLRKARPTATTTMTVGLVKMARDIRLPSPKMPPADEQGSHAKRHAGNRHHIPDPPAFGERGPGAQHDEEPV
jgi:hypothetical protein